MLDESNKFNGGDILPSLRRPLPLPVAPIFPLPFNKQEGNGHINLHAEAVLTISIPQRKQIQKLE